MLPSFLIRFRLDFFFNCIVLTLAMATHLFQTSSAMHAWMNLIKFHFQGAVSRSATWKYSWVPKREAKPSTYPTSAEKSRTKTLPEATSAHDNTDLRDEATREAETQDNVFGFLASENNLGDAESTEYRGAEESTAAGSTRPKRYSDR